MADGEGTDAPAAFGGDQVSGASLPLVSSGDAVCQSWAAFWDDGGHQLLYHGSHSRAVFDESALPYPHQGCPPVQPYLYLLLCGDCQELLPDCFILGFTGNILSPKE